MKAFTPKLTNLVLALLTALNSAALAVDCSRPCPSQQAALLCAQACASDRALEQQTFGGHAVLKAKPFCSSMRVQDAAPVLAAVRVEAPHFSPAFAAALLSAMALVLPLRSRDLYFRGPPRACALYLAFLAVCPQNAPPVSRLS